MAVVEVGELRHHPHYSNQVLLEAAVEPHQIIREYKHSIGVNRSSCVAAGRGIIIAAVASLTIPEEVDNDSDNARRFRYCVDKVLVIDPVVAATAIAIAIAITVVTKIGSNKAFSHFTIG